MKQISLIFDESDLLSDKEKTEDMHLWHDEALISEFPKLALIQETKSQ